MPSIVPKSGTNGTGNPESIFLRASLRLSTGTVSTRTGYARSRTPPTFLTTIACIPAAIRLSLNCSRGLQPAFYLFDPFRRVTCAPTNSDPSRPDLPPPRMLFAENREGPRPASPLLGRHCTAAGIHAGPHCRTLRPAGSALLKNHAAPDKHMNRKRGRKLHHRPARSHSC